MQGRKQQTTLASGKFRENLKENKRCVTLWHCHLQQKVSLKAKKEL